MCLTQRQPEAVPKLLKRPGAINTSTEGVGQRRYWDETETEHKKRLFDYFNAYVKAYGYVYWTTKPSRNISKDWTECVWIIWVNAGLNLHKRHMMKDLFTFMHLADGFIQCYLTYGTSQYQIFTTQLSWPNLYDHSIYWFCIQSMLVKFIFNFVCSFFTTNESYSKKCRERKREKVYTIVALPDIVTHLLTKLLCVEITLSIVICICIICLYLYYIYATHTLR